MSKSEVMRKIRSNQVGIDQGDLVMFSDFDTDGPMWADTGPREVRKPVLFSKPYIDLPVVHVSLSMCDLDSGTNPRADIKAENVNVRGFDLVFRTWSDTRVARARANWLSIGALPHEDDWDLY